MAIRLDIPVDQGSDVRVPLTIVDDWKEMDLTGYTARMQCRPFAASRKVVDLLTTENGRIKMTVRSSSSTGRTRSQKPSRLAHTSTTSSSSRAAVR